MYGSTQGPLHKKVQLHIKNCSNYKESKYCSACGFSLQLLSIEAGQGSALK